VQLRRFLMVGGTTVLVDLLTYAALLWAGMAVAPAKGIGFVTGTVYAYFANRSFTFATHGSTARFTGFAVLYTVTLAVNVGVNSAVIELGAGSMFTAAAFLIATGTSATLNFLGMKFLIFRSSSLADPT
jgi:putative flippase GtrA